MKQMKTQKQLSIYLQFKLSQHGIATHALQIFTIDVNGRIEVIIIHAVVALHHICHINWNRRHISRFIQNNCLVAFDFRHVFSNDFTQICLKEY